MRFVPHRRRVRARSTAAFNIETIEPRLLLSGTPDLTHRATPAAAGQLNPAALPVPSITLTYTDQTSATVQPGASESVEVTVTGSGVSPTGTVVVEWYNGSSYSLPLTSSNAGGSAVADATLTFTPSTAGPALTGGAFVNDYVLFAFYQGDSNYAPTAPLNSTDVATLNADTAGSIPTLSTNAWSLIDFAGTASVESLVFQQQPVSTAVGATLKPAVTVAVEDGGVVDTSSSAVVTLSLAGPSTTLDGTLSQTASSGIATFNDLSIPTQGQYTLTATSGNDTPAVSATFSITAGKLVFLQQPTSGTVNEPLNPPVRVALENGTGQLITDSAGTVSLTPQGATSTDIAGNTAALVNGVATFDDLTLDTPGVFTLQASDGSDTVANSAKFKMGAETLAFTQQPGTVDVEDPILAKLSLKTGRGQIDHSFTGEILLTVTDLTAGDSTTLTSPTPAVVNGVAVLSAGSGLSLDAVGQYKITAQAMTPTGTGTFAVDSSIAPVTSRVFNVLGPKLVFSTQPGPVSIGEPVTVRVTADAPTGRPDPNFGGTVTFTLNARSGGAGATLGSDTASINGGSASFQFTLNTLGTYTLTAADPSTPATATTPASPGAASAISRPFTVGPLRLKFTQQPTTVSTGEPIVVSVSVFDSKGKVDPYATGVIALDLTVVSGGVGAQLNTPAVPLSNGVASFTTASAITLSVPGSYKLTPVYLTDNSGSLIAVDVISTASKVFKVTA